MKRLRIFTIIITVFMLCALVCFASCNSGSSDDSLTSASTGDVADDVKELVFLENGKSDFTLIRADEEHDYYKVTLAALKVRLDSTFNTIFAINTDWENPNKPTSAEKNEILLGPTVREESKKAIEDLSFNGYIIRVTDHKIVIVGSGMEQTNEALKHFCDVILTDEKYVNDGRISFPVGLEVKKELDCDSTLDVGAALLDGEEVIGNIKKVYGRAGKNGFSASQGAACDGEHVYIIMKKNSDGIETDCILKVDMNTWELVAESEELPLDHGNDMTYDSKAKRLVVTNMKDNLITIIDPETLTVTETLTLPFASWAVAYSAEANRFVFRGSGQPSGIVITDENFNVITEGIPTFDPFDESGYVGQGVDADENYIYIPQSPQGGVNNNRIWVFDWNGKICGIAYINTSQEIETIFNYNGKLYANFNQSGTTVYELEFYVKFK